MGQKTPIDISLAALRDIRGALHVMLRSLETLEQQLRITQSRQVYTNEVESAAKSRKPKPKPTATEDVGRTISLGGGWVCAPARVVCPATGVIKQNELQALPAHLAYRGPFILFRPDGSPVLDTLSKKLYRYPTLDAVKDEAKVLQGAASG